jgi:protein SCO1/2
MAMKSKPPLPVIGAMLVALVVIAIATWIVWRNISREDAQTGNRVSGTTATTVKIGGPFSLVDHRGRRVSDASFRGRYMLIYFGYGYCPDVCPTELATMGSALDALAEHAAAIQPMFITIDPARDTPAFLAEYVAQFHPRLLGLSGTEDEIALAAKAYRVYYARAKSGSATDYLMDHTSFVYFMGPDGRYLTLFRRGADPEEMAAQMRRLMAAAGTLQSKS